jgi:hypothetical protein
VSEVEQVPNTRDQICEWIKLHMDVGCYGIDLKGWDVLWGTFPTQQGPVTGYALIMTATGRGIGGAVLLGQQTLAQNFHMLGPLPSEQEVKNSIPVSYDGLRTLIAKQIAGNNGQTPPPLAV